MVNLLCPTDLAGKVGIDGDHKVDQDLLCPGLLQGEKTMPLVTTH